MRGIDPTATAGDAAIVAGIIINGLPILGLEPLLKEHYRDRVIGGPGTFLITAASYQNFADAILRTLFLEIASGSVSPAPSRLPTRLPISAPRLEKHRPTSMAQGGSP